MLDPSKVLKSTKRVGIHEKRIIAQLSKFFEESGYHVLPHSRFNIAWGSIISDVDILLIKDNILTLVEVKSSHDNLQRITKQFSAIQDYVDYAFVATDYHPRKKIPGKIGIIVATDEKIEIIRDAKQLVRNPSLDSVMSLKKSALSNLLGLPDGKVSRISKFELAARITKKTDGSLLKEHLKSIVTCNV